MKNTINVNVQAQGMSARKGEVRTVNTLRNTAFFLLLILASALQTAQAQSADIIWTDLDSFKVGYYIDTRDSILEAESGYSVKLYLETIGSQECVGANFDMLWSPDVQPDPDGEYSVPGSSWLGQSNALITGFSETPGQNQGDYSLIREDVQSQSGSGWVMTAHFTVGDSAISTESVVTALGGGLVIMDNLDMKMAPPGTTPQATATVYPNPFADRIHVKTAYGKAAHLRLIDIKGQTVATKLLESDAAWNLPHTDPGIYFIEIREEDQAPQVLRIVKQ